MSYELVRPNSRLLGFLRAHKVDLVLRAALFLFRSDLGKELGLLLNFGPKVRGCSEVIYSTNIITIEIVFRPGDLLYSSIILWC